MEKVRAAGVGVTQLLPIQPHPLLLLQVGGQPAQHLQTCEEGWGATGGDGGGVPAEWARDLAPFLFHRHGHDPGDTLQTEGVGAVQQLGRLEDIVVGVVTDGALGLATKSNHFVQVHILFLGHHLGVPHLRDLRHLEGVFCILFSLSLVLIGTPSFSPFLFFVFGVDYLRMNENPDYLYFNDVFR